MWKGGKGNLDSNFPDYELKRVARVKAFYLVPNSSLIVTRLYWALAPKLYEVIPS